MFPKDFFKLALKGENIMKGIIWIVTIAIFNGFQMNLKCLNHFKD